MRDGRIRRVSTSGDIGFSEKGARAMARLVLQGLIELDAPLAREIRDAVRAELTQPTPKIIDLP